MKDAVKLYSSGYTDIFLKDGVCVKKMYHSHLYTHFADYNQKFLKFVGNKDYCVKVLEVRGSNEYTMEYFDILSTVDRYLDPYNPDFNKNIQENILDEIQRVFLQLQIDCMRFSKKFLPKGKYWVHKDLHLSNFVITKDRKVKLIDIDSFMVTESPLDSSYIGTFAVLTSRLQHAYDTKRLLEITNGRTN